VAQTPIVIEQRIDAGSQFDETLPATTPVNDKAIRTFPSTTQGGLFQFDFTGPDASFVTYQIEQIFADFADAATVEIAVIDSAGTPNRSVIVSPGAGSYIRVEPFTLAWDQKLTLKTLGATGAMMARVMASPQRTKQE